MYIFENLQFIYKRLPKYTRTHKTRNEDLVNNYSKLKKRQTGPHFYGIQMFNKLPLHITVLPTNSSKKSVKNLYWRKLYLKCNVAQYFTASFSVPYICKKNSVNFSSFYTKIFHNY